MNQERSSPMAAMADSKVRPVMALTDVDVTIGTAAILSGITCTFPPQGVTGLIGQNGSGKSTLLKVLARQQSIARGRVTFMDRPLDACTERAFARQVAYLPQHMPATSGLTAKELVTLGRYPWHGPLGRFGAADAAKVEAALTLTEMKGFAERLVDTLSGGERQRCWLAMLLAQDGRLLLLDEPISALDIAHQISVLRLVRRISRDNDVCVIVVIHDINLAARFCDHLVALKSGRLMAQGTPHEFMTPSQLEAIYDVSMGVTRNPETGEPLGFVRDEQSGPKQP
jgi:iron-chelate-transporting ATPase